MCVNTQGPTRKVKATPRFQILNIIRVTQQGPPIGPGIRNIVDERDFGDLLKSSFVADAYEQLQHFALTPFYTIPTGWQCFKVW